MAVFFGDKGKVKDLKSLFLSNFFPRGCVALHLILHKEHIHSLAFIDKQHEKYVTGIYH